MAYGGFCAFAGGPSTLEDMIFSVYNVSSLGFRVLISISMMFKQHAVYMLLCK